MGLHESKHGTARRGASTLSLWKNLRVLPIATVSVTLLVAVLIVTSKRQSTHLPVIDFF
jgi:hypothetical protein